MRKINKSKYLKPIYENIPDELKRYPQWVVWKGKEIDGKSKKVPYNPMTNNIARVDNHKTWAEFNAAAKAYENGGYDGIGFVLTEKDRFIGFDFDNCRNPQTKKIKSWARKYIHELNTYTELSPSGKGIRGFAIGKLPPEGRKKGNIELYDKGHYLTITGHHYPNSPTIIRNRRRTIVTLHSEIFSKNKTDKTTIQPEDKARLKKAFESKNGSEIKKLYNGDHGDYASRSEADLAFCNHLAFWFNRDAERIDRVFRASKLYRKKWDEKRRKDGRTYGEITTQKAIDSTQDTYLGEEKYIEELNKKHAVIMMGGRCLVMNEVFDPVFKRPDINFSSLTDFKNRYLNRKTLSPIGDSKVGIAKLWLESPRRSEYKGIVFNPGEDNDEYYNLFRGFDVQPKEGDWSLFRQHIHDVIVNKNKEYLTWLLAWMARIIQDPGGERPGTAIVLIGKQGTGKGVFATTFGRIIGSHFLHMSNRFHLVGRFNSHFKNAILVFCDDAYWKDDKDAEGIIKGLITERETICEAKGRDAYAIKNHVNLILASNNEWVIPAGLEERRFFVLNVSEEHMQDHEYFKAIIEQMNKGGIEAMLYDLQRMDISRVNLRKAPRTEALFHQITKSMSPIHKFWYERLLEGTLCEQHPKWRKWIITKTLYKEYREFCKELNGEKPEIRSGFSKELKKLCPDIVRKRHKEVQEQQGRKKSKKRSWGYSFPDLTTCREQFEEKVRMKLNWD